MEGYNRKPFVPDPPYAEVYKAYSELGYGLEKTEDGTWTLRWLTHPQTESMHNPRGALSETISIYGRAADMITKPKPCLLSVGLGMGYVELLLASKFPDVECLYSFESIEFLKAKFLNWVRDEEPNPVYDDISQAFPQGKARLKEWDLQNKFLILGDLLTDYKDTQPADLILYDAFSAKSSPDLWSQDFLTTFLKHTGGAGCILSSYAATGNLNRAIRGAGFVRQDASGWGGKRESTLAIKIS